MEVGEREGKFQMRMRERGIKIERRDRMRVTVGGHEGWKLEKERRE